MAKKRSTPPCPHCGTKLGYDDAVNDNHECPHCGGRIVWSVPFGTIGPSGLKSSKGGAEWRKERE